MSSNIANRWISRPEPNQRATKRLFCFPYAGSGAAIFRSWPKGLSSDTEVCAIQLPGRGQRMTEAPFTSMDPLVWALTDALLPLLDKPFGFFGHSMGAWVSFEVARRLQSNHALEPIQLFASGAWSPQIGSRETPIHDLPEPEFLEALKLLNGTPREVLDHPELMKLLLPILRADFEVCELYKYAPGSPLKCPIMVFGGLEDRKLKRSDLTAWKEHTTSSFTLRMLPGDHFFLHSTEPEILRTIAQALRESAN